MPKQKAFGCWRQNDYAEWKLDVAEDGLYDVYLQWSLDDKQALNKYSFEIGGIFINGVTEVTGSWKTFKTAKIGQMKLKAGVQTAVFLPSGRFNNELLNLRDVKLVPVK